MAVTWKILIFLECIKTVIFFLIKLYLFKNCNCMKIKRIETCIAIKLGQLYD